MNFEQAMEYLNSKPEAELCYPFYPDVPVYKICGKVFALLSPIKKGDDKSARPDAPFLNLKCDPNHALELRDVFEGVIPAYHMNKKHWNSVLLNDSVPDGEIERQIDHSYSIIVKSLKKVEQKRLEIAYPDEELHRE